MTSKRDMVHRKNSLKEGMFGVPEKYEKQYIKGRGIRKRGQSISICQSLDPVCLAWQRAGWHDADIEAGNSVFNRKAAWSDPALEAFEQYIVK